MAASNRGSPGGSAARVWRGVFALIGGAGLIGQYVLLTQAEVRSSLGPTVVFFSYFTILTNILVALALGIPALAPNSRPGRWAVSPGVRAALAMHIAVVGLIYHALLAGTWNPQGAQLWIDQILHTVMPLAFVLDWLLFTPRGRLRWSDPLVWLIYPLAYGAWCLIHGQIGGWYPYWFIDVSALGWGRAMTNLGGLLVFFLGLGLAVVAIDRALSARTKGDRAPTPS